ncbi:MAG: transketolase [Acidimicrobiaceae bacterium]|nr:transketolase [Acidimicrobiaceae bacterium]
MSNEKMTEASLDRLATTAIRMLSIDQVESANSGHPGLPLGLAPVAYTIYSKFLKFSPQFPNWPDRDRFVLSAGHGSALLYSLLHLFGYELSIEDLKAFRQLGSKTPGHPEYRHTPGVEVTTGPLGQGFATAVGLALAERMAAARINPQTDIELVDHKTFVLASDGDLMEGISHEAGSLAGHLGLSKLIVCFDDNDITIDGPRHQSCTDDVLERFSAYGWHTLQVEDGEDLAEIESQLQKAIDEKSRPSLIAIKTTIGYGAPNKAGKSVAHGGPLGKDEAEATKIGFGWPLEPTFFVPAEVREYLDAILENKALAYGKWLQEFNALGFDPFSQEDLRSALGSLVDFEVGSSLATRIASQKNLQAIMKDMPSLVGGSADLAESTGTKLDFKAIGKDDYTGRIIHFGIREHAMAACSNGLALHGGFRPFCSTFLVFSDYLRPSIRLSAIMGLPVIYIFTHDSIAVGEDGPTHQPIEHLAALRSIPNLMVLRPADANETSEAYKTALEHTTGPCAIILSRQALKTLEPSSPGWMAKDGARVVFGQDGLSEVTILASGSEVGLAIDSAKILFDLHKVRARVVSVPWRERLIEFDEARQLEILGPNQNRLVVEAGIEMGWEALRGPGGKSLVMKSFGTSAPGSKASAHFGYTTEKVVSLALAIANAVSNQDLPDSTPMVSLAHHLLQATEAAAIAAQAQVGLGNKIASDALATEAMRNSLGKMELSAKVVIGEGEKDNAPMLYVDEVLGASESVTFELAVDPLEGTNYAAKGQDGAVSVIAGSELGSLYSTSGYYMEKLVVKAPAKDAIDIAKGVEYNLRAIATSSNKEISDLKFIVLAKPRHDELISQIRSLGAKVVEIPDGDVMASIKVMMEASEFDGLYGIGGAPEGVISACAAKLLGAGMQTRLAPQSEEEIKRLNSLEPDWKDRIMTPQDMVKGDSVVVITAITNSPPLDAPLKNKTGWTTSSLVITKSGERLIHRDHLTTIDQRRAHDAT